MRIPRLYIDRPLQPGESFTLDAETAHRLGRVLRLTAGAELVLFDGRDGECPARLIKLSRQQAVVKVESYRKTARESPLHTHLGLALCRGERMNWAVQKAVETGVYEITLLFSTRSEVKLPASRWERHMARWQQIIIHSCEQSGRTTVPALHPPLELEQWAMHVQADCRLLLHRDAVCELPAGQPRSCALLSGPEGGLSDEEIARTRSCGFRGWSLGPRVLRAEMAPGAALTVLQHRWGDGAPPRQ